MSEANRPQSAGALADLSVVELGDGTAAPFAAKMLGDFGANVIKVEGPDGDFDASTRAVSRRKADPEASGLFLYLNVNKLGVMLDLNREDACRAMQGLLAAADVFVTNLPIQQLRAAGLAPDVAATAVSAAGDRNAVAIRLKRPVGGPARRRAGHLCDGRLAYSTPGMPDASAGLDQRAAAASDLLRGRDHRRACVRDGDHGAVNGRELTEQGCHMDISQQAAVAAMQIRDLMNMLLRQHALQPAAQSHHDRAHAELLSAVQGRLRHGGRADGHPLGAAGGSHGRAGLGKVGRLRQQPGPHRQLDRAARLS